MAVCMAHADKQGRQKQEAMFDRLDYRLCGGYCLCVACDFNYVLCQTAKLLIFSEGIPLTKECLERSRLGVTKASVLYCIQYSTVLYIYIVYSTVQYCTYYILYTVYIYSTIYTVYSTRSTTRLISQMASSFNLCQVFFKTGSLCMSGHSPRSVNLRNPC